MGYRIDEAGRIHRDGNSPTPPPTNTYRPPVRSTPSYPQSSSTSTKSYGGIIAVIVIVVVISIISLPRMFTNNGGAEEVQVPINEFVNVDVPPTDVASQEPKIETTEPVTDNEYILPNSSQRQLTDSDVSGLSKTELRLARNEIYARHGRQFRDSELQEYFDSKAWYQNINKLSLGTEPQLTNLELDNVKLIQKYE